MTKANYATAIRDARKRAESIRQELAAFSKSSKVFSSDEPRLIDKYEDKWVAVYDGSVAAAAKTFSEVTDRVAKLGLPLEDTMIRRVERKTKNFIL